MPLPADDRLAILDLCARYNHAIDAGRGAAWAATFTPDGVFDSPTGKFTGTAELTKFGDGFTGAMRSPRHWTNNHVIEGDGTAATHSCYLILYAVDGGQKILITGLYRDTLQRLDGAWKFVQRTVIADPR